MGNQQVKPEDKLKHINIQVNSLRQSSRRTRNKTSKETQDAYLQNLVGFSKEVDALKGKVKDKNLTRTQENISRTVTEILSHPLQGGESALDRGAVETDSFIEIPTKRRNSASKTTTEIPIKKPRSNQSTMSKHFSTLQDIDLKFKSLKPQVITAIENKDTTQLRVHKKTIEVLATDLELIEISEGIPLGDRKEKLVADLTKQYKKINTAMKEIQRTKDLNYLTSQNTSIRELEEVRKELGRTDAALKAAIKNDDLESVEMEKQQLVEIGKKLTSIKVTNETDSRTKMQMIDQISWLHKYTNESAMKGSQSDLTKAQTNYEDLIKNIASGKNRDNEDIRTKLKSLQTFITNISDVDENEEKKKKQLLNNITESFSSLRESAEKQRADSRKADTTTSNDVLREVEHFCKTIERSIKRVKLSEQEFNDLVRMLENVLRYIDFTRKNLTDQSNLKKTRNYSTPDLTRLSRPSPIRSEFKSTTSLNTSVVPTKVSEHHSVIPRMEIVHDESVEMRKQPGVKRDESCFSAIEQIKTQVNYMKEKIKDIDEAYVKDKLTTFKNTLETYFNHSNQTIANNARLVFADIKDLQTDISNNQELKEIYLYGKLETVQDGLEYMRKIVDEFFEGGAHESFEKITGQLLTCESYLKANGNIAKEQKDELIRKFRTLSRIMEKKANIKETLNSLKYKINRFSGAFKGVLYNKIEKDMNKVIIDASEHIENKKISDEITTEAEKHLKILEHRATKDQSFRQTKSRKESVSEEEKMLRLKTETEHIRSNIDNTANKDVDSFMKLKSRLDLVTLEMDQLKHLNENEDHMKNLIYNDVEALKIIVDSKIATALESRNEVLIRKDENEKEKFRNKLDRIEENLNKLKNEIDHFVGTTSDDKYYELDEYSMKLIIQINNQENIEEGSELQRRKTQLLEEAHHYSDILNNLAIETEALINYERSIADIENNFDHYAKSTKDLEKFAENIKRVKEDLERTNFNRNLRERKQSCVEQIDNVVKKIGARNHNPADKPSGSLKASSAEAQVSVDVTKKLQSTPVSDESKVTLKVLEKESGQIKEVAESKNGAKNDRNSSAKQITSASPLQVEQQNAKELPQQPNNQPGGSIKTQKKTNDTYIGSASFVKDIEMNEKKAIDKVTNPIGTIFDEIEKEIGELNGKISVFNGSDASEEYQELEDDILKQNVRLNLLNIAKDDLLNKRKLELKRKVVTCLDYLDRRVQDLELINNVENELGKISEKLTKEITSAEREELDEKLISLQVKLGKVQLDDEFNNQRQRRCSENIGKYLKELQEKSKSSGSYRDTAV